MVGAGMVGSAFGLGSNTGDPTQDFWRVPKSWPEDQPGYKFLARAILQRGRDLFGQEWDDTDPAATITAPLSENLNLHVPFSEILRASEILKKVHEPYASRSYSSILLGGIGPDYPSRTEWDIARKHDLDRYQAELKILKRYLRVVIELEWSFKAGKIMTGLRESQGGRVEAEPSSFWYGERLTWRFDACKVDPADPFNSSALKNSKPSWIYVDEATWRQPSPTSSASDRTLALAAEVVVERRTKTKAGRKRMPAWDYLMAEFVRIVHQEGIPEVPNITGLAERLITLAEADDIEGIPAVKTLSDAIRKWISKTELD